MQMTTAIGRAGQAIFSPFKGLSKRSDNDETTNGTCSSPSRIVAAAVPNSSSSPCRADSIRNSIAKKNYFDNSDGSDSDTDITRLSSKHSPMKNSLVDAISEHVSTHTGNAYDNYEDISGSLSSRYSAAISASSKRDDEFDTNAPSSARYSKPPKTTASTTLPIKLVNQKCDDDGVDDHRQMVASKSQNITSDSQNKPVGRAIAATTKFLSSSENLRAELELLKIQNQMLTTRIQRTRDESSQQLEMERSHRMKQVSELQSENQRLNSELTTVNLDAQAMLAKEKEYYLSMLKDMQREKDTLHKRIRQTSELAQHEVMLVYLQKTELEEKLLSLDETRADLEARLSNNKLQSDRPPPLLLLSGSRNNGDNTSPSPHPHQLSLVELESERNALLDAMKQLTEEKLQLQTTWSETEEAAASNQTRLRVQLEQEQRSMAEYTKKIEQEQREMSLHLRQAELRMKEEAAAVVERLSREKSEALLALQAITDEKRQLHDLINAYTSSPSPDATTKGDDGQVLQQYNKGKDSINTANNSIHSSVESIDQLSSMRASMETLRLQLQEKEQLIKQREQQLEEQASREKEELKKAVLKMREEMLAEKEQQQQQQSKHGQEDSDSSSSSISAAPTTPHRIGDGMIGAISPSSQKSKGSTDSAHSSFSSSSKKHSPGAKLTSNKSLFDILEGNKPLPSTNNTAATTIAATTTATTTTTTAVATTIATGVGGGKERSRLSAITDKRNKIDFKINVRSGKPSTPSPQQQQQQQQHREPHLLTERLSSYHKINLNKHQEIETTTTAATATTATSATATTATSEVQKQQGSRQKKTFMDLDSDDDSDRDRDGGATGVDDDGVDGSHSNYEVGTKSTVDTMKKSDTIIFNKNISETMHHQTGSNSIATTATKSKEVSLMKHQHHQHQQQQHRNGEGSGQFTGTLGRDEKTGREKYSGELFDYSSSFDEDSIVQGLPAPHAAAAMNDVRRLRMFAEKGLSLLMSLDSALRQPIFYAAAYGRIEAVTYLLTALPDKGLGLQHGLQWVRGDVHGDTPLHAAASSGCGNCTRVLLEALKEHPNYSTNSGNLSRNTKGTYSPANLRNNMEMTPVHLASSIAVLDVLYQYDADVQALDCNRRTPLFIACAMNREECSDFLISMIDHTTGSKNKEGEELLYKDKRGDTPLHAAACNGSIECLLLLLQHGIDPRLSNNSGLKAIDLAVCNRHKRCKDILAEYHLHYCTSTEFDSMLFLATLQGHKIVREKSGKAGDVSADNHSGVEYTIIQSNPTEELGAGTSNPATSSIRGHHFNRSMFSLRSELSMRLQRWGDWIAYYDTQSQTKDGERVFWYNHTTAQCQWHQPEEVTQLIAQTQQGYQEKSSEDHLVYNNEKFLTRKASMRLKQISTDWIQYVTEKGRLFYYNDADGSFQWENPLLELNHGLSSSSSSTATTAVAEAGKKNRGVVAKTTSSSSSSGGNTNDITASQGRSSHHHQSKDDKDYIDLSTFPMWKAYLDPDSGSIFWYNEETHVSQWEMPQEVEDQHKLKSTAADSAIDGTAASMSMSEESSSYCHGDQQGRHLDLQLSSGSNEKYSITTFNLSNTTRSSGSGHHRHGSEEFEDNEGVVITVDDHEHDLGI